MAQRATTCYSCGASLENDLGRPRLAIRWADIMLFVVIGGLLAFWWTHPPVTASVRPVVTVTPTPVPSPDLAWLTSPTAASATPPAVAPPTPTTTPLPPTPAPTAKPIEHRVAAGESVPLIAEKYDVKTKDVIALNELPANGAIHPGQVLKIPGTAAPVPPTPTPTPTGGTLIYTIKQGDTLFGLAVDFHTDLDLILAANHIKENAFLGVGDHILIPLSASTPVPTATPTATPVPPTFTPQAGFRSPALLMPPDNAVLSDSAEVVLNWTTVGLLAEDEWYVVILRPAGAAVPQLYWTKTTSLRLSTSDLPTAAGSTSYTWQVQIVRVKPGQGKNSPTPLGPPTTTRQFTW